MPAPVRSNPPKGVVGRAVVIDVSPVGTISGLCDEGPQPAVTCPNLLLGDRVTTIRCAKLNSRDTQVLRNQHNMHGDQVPSSNGVVNEILLALMAEDGLREEGLSGDQKLATSRLGEPRRVVGVWFLLARPDLCRDLVCVDALQSGCRTEDPGHEG